MKLILASGSPRRREILASLGYEFDVVVTHAAETFTAREPRAAAQEIALAKACAAAERYPEALVVGADTAVWLDGRMLGKPADRADACRMLRALSDRTHEVVTGVAVVCGGEAVTGACVTSVEFGHWTDAEIDAYVAIGSPMDKAGAYGIQELSDRLARAIGDYDNVVGLPAAMTDAFIRKFTEKHL